MFGGRWGAYYDHFCVEEKLITFKHLNGRCLGMKEQALGLFYLVRSGKDSNKKFNN
jgi:hypothetical protein